MPLKPEKYLQYLLVASVLAVVAYIRIRLLDVPLERDEGEFAYMGQLLLKGIPPYIHAYTMKLPGVSIVYALFMSLFGQTPQGVHAGLLVVNGICILLVYLLTKRLFSHDAGLYSSASYAVLSLSSSLLGIFAHATHFVVLFVLTGFLLLLRSIDKKQILLLLFSGLCFGMAIAMKQHAVLLWIFAVLCLCRQFWPLPLLDKRFSVSGSILFLLGTVLPYALIVLWTVAAGSFANFWFWTVQYAREYTSLMTLEAGWFLFKYSFVPIVKSQLPLWLLAGFGCILLLTNRRCCADRFFVFGLLLFSFFAICPGLLFRNHYFVLLLPAVSMLAGAALTHAGTVCSALTNARFAQLFPVILCAVAVTYGLYHEKDIFFVRSPLEASREINGVNPFPESLQIAKFIKNNTSPDDKVAVFGSEPEILFYADRLSATGHIYMYGLMENQPYAESMQMQMIREVETARPAYIVFVNVDVSWLMQRSSSRTVLTWGKRYINYFYERVGVIDIGPDATDYIWGNAVAEYMPESDFYVTIFKRKQGM